MGLDRVFSTPTIEVDQDKYDELIKIKTLWIAWIIWNTGITQWILVMIYL